MYKVVTIIWFDLFLRYEVCCYSIMCVATVSNWYKDWYGIQCVNDISDSYEVCCYVIVLAEYMFLWYLSRIKCVAKEWSVFKVSPCVSMIFYCNKVCLLVDMVKSVLHLTGFPFVAKVSYWYKVSCYGILPGWVLSFWGTGPCGRSCQPCSWSPGQYGCHWRPTCLCPAWGTARCWWRRGPRD